MSMQETKNQLKIEFIYDEKGYLTRANHISTIECFLKKLIDKHKKDKKKALEEECWGWSGEATIKEVLNILSKYEN